MQHMRVKSGKEMVFYIIQKKKKLKQKQEPMTWKTQRLIITSFFWGNLYLKDNGERESQVMFWKRKRIYDLTMEWEGEKSVLPVKTREDAGPNSSMKLFFIEREREDPKMLGYKKHIEPASFSSLVYTSKTSLSFSFSLIHSS